MILLETNQYRILRNKLGFLDLYDKNNHKVKRLGHHLFLNNLKKCDDSNFIITFARLNFSFEHYNIFNENYIETSFNTTSLLNSNVYTFKLNEEIYGAIAVNKYGGSFILYNWQTKKYYIDYGDKIPDINEQQKIVIPKKIKYDDEKENLYFEDQLYYELDPKTFEIINAYSTLQQRNINFKGEEVKKVLQRECLENMKTLAIYQKANLLEKEEVLKRVYK